MAETEAKKEKFIEADAGDGTKREEQFLEGPKLILCVLSIVLCLFLTGLDQTIVSTILTTLGNRFDAFGKVEWIISGFFLPMTVFAATWGQISIVVGRKYCMIISVVLFEAGSLMCALAPNMNTLIGGRVLAGIGGSGIQSLTFIIVAEVLPMNVRPFVFMITFLVMSVSIVLGPIIGGAIASNTTWRWCFYINLPIGGVAIAILLIVFNPPIPRLSLREKLLKIDYFGTFLCAAGIVLLLLGFTFASDGEFKWHSAAVISSIVLGGIITIAFLVWSLKFSKNPIIQREIFPIHQLDTAFFCWFSLNFAFVSVIFFLPLYFQNIFNKSPIGSGVSMLAMVIPTVTTNVVLGAAIGRSRLIKPFLVAGAAVSCIGAGLLTLLETDSSYQRRIGYLILFGIGSGLLMQSSMTGTQLHAPKVEGGVIMTMAFLSFLRGLGGAMSSIVCNIVYNSLLSQYLPKTVASLPDGATKTQLSQVSVAALQKSTGILQKLSPEATHIVKKEMMRAIRGVFYMVLGVELVIFCVSLFTSNKKVPAKDEVRTKEEREAMDLEAELKEKDEEKDEETDHKQSDAPEQDQLADSISTA